MAYEKVEGVAVTADSNVYIVNDNDGVDDNSGETQLIGLGDIFRRGSARPATPTADDNFVRISSFPVCLQDDENCDTPEEDETVAEIAAVSTDGNTIVYTDGPGKRVGFVDITDATAPAPLGVTVLDGEPTSVAVKGDVAVVGVNTTPPDEYVDTSGQLVIVDVATRMVVRSIDVDGQPDSVAVSPDGDYIAVVIENERDEELNDGELPQLPAGMLVIIDSSDADPANWAPTATSPVDMTGLAGYGPTDPEPEYVDINADNIAVVTLQENNHIVLVDVTNGQVTADFTAGTVDLTQVDVIEEEPALIDLSGSVDGVAREPDGVSWIGTDRFATADEGDLFGGSRGFTIFDTEGNVVMTSGNQLEHEAVRLGHYPEGRSEKKGNEPENVEFATFGDIDYLFVASERSSLVFVYDVTDPDSPEYLQALPAGVGPEGVLAIPSRDLLIAASEKDERGAKMRSVLNIYERQVATSPSYPTLASEDREDGTPIPWSALSGLAAHPSEADTLYAVDDSFYQRSRIFTVDLSSSPAKIVDETYIVDSDDVLAAVPVAELSMEGLADTDPERRDVFDEADLAAMINDDKTVNLDSEGIAVASGGGFWIASEGAGTWDDEARPINSRNFVLKVTDAGVIEAVVQLPAAVEDVQLRFGFEGITEYDGKVYVAMQRAWSDDPQPRIGVYDPASETWGFYFYPLDEVASLAGGWVGLSDLVALGEGVFLAVERDNQGTMDAAIKQLTTFDVTGIEPGN
ncbi:MAG: esterase-like activity of phytase family protein [Myxococcales bacterium FL481]|nr:MAG: esterase-like activity of phytase family protein [Myxococcales bacterium FL481]